MLTYKAAGAPAGQKTLPLAVFEQLKARLATPTGFASYLDVQHWLRQEFALLKRCTKSSSNRRFG